MTLLLRLVLALDMVDKCVLEKWNVCDIIICWVGWESNILYLRSDTDVKDYMNFLYHSPIELPQASW